jgi:hypothetical protein
MELQITEFEEHIYNLHLRTTRQQQGQPYKLRKKFDTLDSSSKIYLKKLSCFFNKHTHIGIEDFFTAPFTLYPDETFFDLQYFTTLKAVKSFTLYQKHLQNLAPDSNDQLLRIQQSIKFILNFCKEHKIDIHSYISYKKENLPYFLLHLKEYKVNFYTLYGFLDFERAFKAIDNDIIKFMFDEQIYELMRVSKVKLYGSKKAKTLVDLGLQRASELLKKTVD